MKVTVRKLAEDVVRREYPIAGRVPGWFFRMIEQSMCVWRVEGTDLWGRAVSDVGADERRVLESGILMATEINKQLGIEPQAPQKPRWDEGLISAPPQSSSFGPDEQVKFVARDGEDAIT